ncbi:hypothetical protein L7F22_020869 [Adiantum nelumboides]|nr:hypothetical protein [Adiantum nelumboides]
MESSSVRGVHEPSDLWCNLDGCGWTSFLPTLPAPPLQPFAIAPGDHAAMQIDTLCVAAQLTPVLLAIVPGVQTTIPTLPPPLVSRHAHREFLGHFPDTWGVERAQVA